MMNEVNGLHYGGSKDISTVRQIIEIVAEENKYNMIKDVINYLRPDDKAVIFCSNKARACDLSTELHIDLRCETLCIQSSRDKVARGQAIVDFTSGEVRILIATDIALQGLHIADVTHVINYDFPHNIEEYVQRVGRARHSGTCITYLTPDNWAQSTALINVLKQAKQEIPEKLYDMARGYAKWKERRRTETTRHNAVRERRDNYQRL
ncbi:hypothetical protein DOY81_004836 [Sarcophaga bullata]|nr:hypothetical protein DOY81_004836 [Sarcophaga bullata]